MTIKEIDRKITAEFRDSVLAHITDTLSTSEWDRFRVIAADPASAKIQGLQPLAHAAPAELVAAAMSQDDLTLDESIPPPYRPLVEVVASVAGMPVYYVAGEGVYLWAADSSSDVLSVWLTHPAYPPSW